MRHNYIFENVNDALPRLMGDLLVYGDEFGSRNGRTKELMHVGITLDKPWQRELVLPERKANLAAQIAETMWVLAGRNDIEWLGRYLPRAVDFSDDGQTWRAGYGPRLRGYGEDSGYGGIDQLEYIVDTMRSNPGSRQAVATLWDPEEDTTPGKDIACNNWLSFSSRLGKVDLHVGIRSNDAMWGWSGINAFEWSALLEIVAGMCSLEVGSLHFSVTSFHLYDVHWEKARRIAQADSLDWLRTAGSPRFNATGLDDMAAFDEMRRMWFVDEAEIRRQALLPAHSRNLEHVITNFPEPMLQSWLRVLAWWWTGEHMYLEELRGTRLYEAAKCSVQPKVQVPCACGQLKVSSDGSYRTELGGTSHGLTPCYAVTEDAEMARATFLGYANTLHAEKHAAYGDSWKRRGEYMILANIARKIDRLEGGAETSDETQADTAIDLLVYTAKYHCWLNGGTGDPGEVEKLLYSVRGSYAGDVDHVIDYFGRLEKATDLSHKITCTDLLLGSALALARARWSR